MAGFIVLFAGLTALPHLLSYSQQEILVFLVINVLVVVSYRLLTLTGEWSLGHVVMVGVGAYASALFTKKLGVPVPISMLCGALTAAVVAFALSFPLFRMKGFYFLIGSFAAGEIIRLIWKRFTDPFGGPKGIKLHTRTCRKSRSARCSSISSSPSGLLLLLPGRGLDLRSWIMYRHRERSPIGLTFHAIHWQDKLAESVGVEHPFRFRMHGLRHCVLLRRPLRQPCSAHYVGTINPKQLRRRPRWSTC